MAIAIGSASELGVSPEAVAAFYRANWQRRIALGLPEFYRWQFMAAPESNSGDHCCVALQGDEIVGVMGLNPRSFMLAGARRRSAELTTWVVAASARGHGVGRGILAYLMQRHDVLVGPGITDAALPLYLDAGFRLVRALPRFAQVFADNLGEPFVTTTARGREAIKRRRPGARVKGEPIEVAEVADLAERHLRDLNHYTRDAASLAWRYRDHPVFRYEFFRVGDAAVGVRCDNVDGVGIAHIVECFGKPAVLSDVMAFLDGFCRDRNIGIADFTGLASAINGVFLAEGWFSAVDDKDVQVTNLFHPPEIRDPATSSLVLWARDDRAALFDLGRLYVTKGDLDLDRPTMAYYERSGLAESKASTPTLGDRLQRSVRSS
jgi:hypothetical protein